MNLARYTLKRRLLWLAIAWSLVGTVTYLSLAPLAVPLPAEGGDKYAHIATYAVLMFWFAQIYNGVRPRIAIAVGLAALGVGLEYLQGYTGYRTFEYADMVANAAGVVVGWLIAPPRTPNFLVRVDRLVNPSGW